MARSIHDYSSKDPYTCYDNIHHFRENFVRGLGANKAELRAATDAALEMRRWNSELPDVPLTDDPDNPNIQDFIRLEQWFTSVHRPITEVMEDAWVALEESQHEEQERPVENWHNEDFTQVRWSGHVYKFDKAQQALAVEYLWRNKRGREKSIGEAIGSEAENFRLIHIFRQQGKSKEMHPAWGTMIVPDGKGIFALAENKNPPKK